MTSKTLYLGFMADVLLWLLLATNKDDLNGVVLLTIMILVTTIIFINRGSSE